MATEVISSTSWGVGEAEAVVAGAPGMTGPAIVAGGPSMTGPATTAGEGRLGEAGLREGAIRWGEAGPGEGAIRWREAGPGEGAIRWGEARWAFEEMRGQLEAYEPGEPVAPRINVGRAAAVVHSVAVRDAAPERRAAFAALAGAGRYELSLLDELLRLARCTWYLRRQQQRSMARASEASVPEADVTAAYALRARMMRVVAHWLGDRADIATELTYLREGSGYLDLANDLETLAELYTRDDVRAMIAHDIKHYAASDVAEAGRLAELIFRAIGLGEEGQAERLTAMTYRAAALLQRAYEEHRVCGQFLFRNDENVAVTYPSLVTASRRPRRRRRADEAAGDEGPAGEPVEGDAIGSR